MSAKVLDDFYGTVGYILQTVMPKAVAEEGAMLDFCPWFPDAFEQLRSAYFDMAAQLDGRILRPGKIEYTRYSELTLEWAVGNVHFALSFNGSEVERTKRWTEREQIFSDIKSNKYCTEFIDELIELYRQL